MQANRKPTDRKSIIGITNQKGGVGKTTTAVNLAQALVLQGQSVLLIDADPQGNATQACGLHGESLQLSLSQVIRDRHCQLSSAIYQKDGLAIVPATADLARVEREMVGLTNSELRLTQKVRALGEQYEFIILDCPPTFGPLLNSVLNTAQRLIIPVDGGVFALHGIKGLLSEIAEIQLGTNPRLSILGFLLTLADSTNLATTVLDNLIAHFGDQVFETSIRRSVKLKEAPGFGRSIFHHAPQSSGARDYAALAKEVTSRMRLVHQDLEPHQSPQPMQNPPHAGSVSQGVSCE